MNDMKDAFNEFNKKLDDETLKREESEKDIFTHIKQVMFQVKGEMSSEKEKREKFEENIFHLLEDTTSQLASIK